MIDLNNPISITDALNLIVNKDENVRTVLTLLYMTGYGDGTGAVGDGKHNERAGEMIQEYERLLGKETPAEESLCSICGEPQIQTPHGKVCCNGHGGAPPKLKGQPNAK